MGQGADQSNSTLQSGDHNNPVRHEEPVIHYTSDRNMTIEAEIYPNTCILFAYSLDRMKRLFVPIGAPYTKKFDAEPMLVRVNAAWERHNLAAFIKSMFGQDRVILHALNPSGEHNEAYVKDFREGVQRVINQVGQSQFPTVRLFAGLEKPVPPNDRQKISMVVALHPVNLDDVYELYLDGKKNDASGNDL